MGDGCSAGARLDQLARVGVRQEGWGRAPVQRRRRRGTTKKVGCMERQRHSEAETEEEAGRGCKVESRRPGLTKVVCWPVLVCRTGLGGVGKSSEEAPDEARRGAERASLGAAKARQGMLARAGAGRSTTRVDGWRKGGEMR